jgi:hypothetical protein
VSSEMIPFAGQLPAYLQGRGAMAKINKDVVTAAAYPTLRIKGKVFTLAKDNEKQVLTTKDADGDEIPAASVQLNVIRANTKSRQYYAASYTEGESEGQRPTCFSNDGVAPDDGSVEKQSPKCATCPHAVWGSKQRDDGSMGEGTECSPSTRAAVTFPNAITGEHTAFLLRIPAGSKKNFADAVKMAETRSIPYNALIFKVSFDAAAASPKLVFKPVGLLDEAQFAAASKRYDDPLVADICGLPRLEAVESPVAAGPLAISSDELDAAIAAREVTTKVVEKAKVVPAAPAPAPAAKVTPAPAPAPAAKAKTPVASVAAMDDILGDLDSLLGGTTDD